MSSPYEDRVTAFLATEADATRAGTTETGAAKVGTTQSDATRAGAAATPAMRLLAMRLIAILRSLTSSEVRVMVAGLPHDQASAVLTDWLLAAARSCGGLAHE